jgi:hypothetical protein
MDAGSGTAPASAIKAVVPLVLNLNDEGRIVKMILG